MTSTTRTAASAEEQQVQAASSEAQAGLDKLKAVAMRHALELAQMKIDAAYEAVEISDDPEAAQRVLNAAAAAQAATTPEGVAAATAQLHPEPAPAPPVASTVPPVPAPAATVSAPSIHRVATYVAPGAPPWRADYDRTAVQPLYEITANHESRISTLERNGVGGGPNFIGASIGFVIGFVLMWILTSIFWDLTNAQTTILSLVSAGVGAILGAFAPHYNRNQ